MEKIPYKLEHILEKLEIFTIHSVYQTLPVNKKKDVLKLLKKFAVKELKKLEIKK